MLLASFVERVVDAPNGLLRHDHALGVERLDEVKLVLILVDDAVVVVAFAAEAVAEEARVASRPAYDRSPDLPVMLPVLGSNLSPGGRPEAVRAMGWEGMSGSEATIVMSTVAPS